MNLPVFNFQIDTSRLNEFEVRRLMLQAAELRKQGYTYAHIGSTLGCSASYATNLVRVALKEIISDSFEQLIHQETERLNAVFLPAYLEATKVDGNGEPVFNKEATDTVIKIMERRARFLGLDKPTRTELSGDITVGSSKPVHVYIPDNSRGLPAGLVIENGEVIEENMVVTPELPDTIFQEPAPMDISELLYAANAALVAP